MILQITTLVNHKEQGRRSERALKAIHEIGKVVSFAVDRFVNVGEQIASENEDVADEMREACEEAKSSGETIFNLTTSAGDSIDDGVPSAAEKSGMVRAARSLLSAVTRVLIIADSVVVKRLLKAVKKVKGLLYLCLNSQLFGSFVWMSDRKVATIYLFCFLVLLSQVCKQKQLTKEKLISLIRHEFGSFCC